MLIRFYTDIVDIHKSEKTFAFFVRCNMESSYLNAEYNQNQIKDDNDSNENEDVELNSKQNTLNDIQGKTFEDVEEKEKWSGKFAFLFTLVGYSAGTADFWRFPFLAWRNGGGML